VLELFFKKYAWTATLALLLCGAVVVARTVNALVGTAVRPRPQIDATNLAAAPSRPVLPTNLDADKLYHLIGVDPPKPVDTPVVPLKPQTCGDKAARPTRTDLRLLLVAAVMAEPVQSSLVTLADAGSRESRVVGVGEEFAGAKLLAVEKVRDPTDLTGNGFKLVAVICNGGTKEYVDAEGGSAPEAPNLGVAPVPGRPLPGRPAGGQMEGIRKVNDNLYTIDKQVIDGALSNLNTLATQARMVPSFKNGVANGFKLFQIQPGSLYSSIGIENGDVITKINGYEINSPDKALEIYQKLRDAAHVTIELDRNGQAIKKDYNVGGP
jgi:general secretion pathway protein C